MTNNSDMLPKRKRSEIVRLKIDGASTTVNTLGDQQTERGVSLVCPFPALEVTVPVKFSSGPNGELRSGSIHRIGVEDDPETGLPRLRLAIRTDDGRSTAITETPLNLIDDSIREYIGFSEKVDHPKDAVRRGIKLGDSSIVVGEIGELEELAGNSEGASQFLDSSDTDPAWVECREMPMPEEILDRMRSRRRYKLARVAAWVVVFAMMGAGVAALERSGFLDLSPMTKMLTGFSLDGLDLQMLPVDQETPVDALAALEFDRNTHTPNPVAEEEDVQLASLAGVQSVTHDIEIASLPEPVDEAPSADQEAAIEESVEDAVEEVIEGGDAAEEKEAMAVLSENADEEASLVSSGNDKDVLEDSESDVTLILPTRWPAEYATAYRVRNPNGVVVDIPGGLVRREGWLEALAAHEMVRSVKAVQRETGARFIVYVHGDLPRFMTSPKTGGISLRLYRPNGDLSVATDQIAMLQ